MPFVYDIYDRPVNYVTADVLAEFQKQATRGAESLVTVSNSMQSVMGMQVPVMRPALKLVVDKA